MNYELFINQTPVLSGSLLTIIGVALLILLVLIYIGRVIWHKFRTYETLKYEFVTIIAHKFRTPLTQIKWLLETVLESEQDSFKKESLISMGKSNEMLISLTNTLVELTDSANKDLATYNFEKANICDVVNKLTGVLKDRFHEKNIFFGIKCSDPEIFVKIDKPRMEFVMQTLIENAINYSPAGRNVEISVSNRKDKAVVSVIDHGIGIDPLDIPRIFSKFFRAPNAQAMDTEGFGVGLFLAKSIMQRHDGKLEVFSEGLGRGTTFTVTLDLVK